MPTKTQPSGDVMAVSPLAGVGEYWSKSNADFEAQNPNLLQRGVRAINPITGFGSAVGAMHDGASSGSKLDMAIAALQAVPVFGAMRAVAPTAKSIAGAAPVLVPSAAKTAAGVATNVTSGVAADVAERNLKAQPAPQQQNAVSDYAGMNAMKRREKELGLADGGRVRPRGFVAGKGTATSDSIPARLSNGEYVLPADTVRAVGVGALDAMREATHKPVKGEQSKAARGFFAGGTPGGVGAWFQDQQREQEQRKQEALAAGQAAEAAAQAPGASGLYMQDRANEMKDQWGQGKYAQAAGTAARTAAQGLGMYALEAADKLATPVIDAARGFGRGLLGSDTNTAKPATQPAPPAAAPSLADQPNPTDQRLAAGTQRSPLNGPVSPPSSPSQPAVASGREVVPGVFNHGRGQYSDNPNGMGMPEGFTGRPSAQNDAILQRMSDQSQAESMARVGLSQYAAEVQRAKNINADEAARNNSVAARMQRLADPFTAEGRAMRNLQMNIDSSLDRNGRPTADTAALVAQSKAMSDGYLAEPNQQRTIEAGLEREGMQQAGANARAMLSSGIDQQRVNLASDEFGLKRETQGIANRSANMIQAMQQQIAAEQDPVKRQGLVQRMRELQGQSNAQQPYEFKVSPNIKNADGSMTEGGAWVFNPNTGKVERVDGASGRQGPSVPSGWTKTGEANGKPVYQDAKGNQYAWAP